MGKRSGIPAAEEGDVAKLRALNALLIAEIAAMRSSRAAGELISPLAKEDDARQQQQEEEDQEVGDAEVVLPVPDDVQKIDADREKDSPVAERMIESGDAAMKLLRVEPVDQKKVANDDELSAVTGAESSARDSSAEEEEEAAGASASLQARLAAMEESLEAADAEKRRVLELLGAKEAEAAATSQRVAELEKRLTDMKLISSSAGGVDPKGKQEKKAPAARDHRRPAEKKKAPVASVAAVTAAPASKVKGKVAAAVAVTAPKSKVGGKAAAGASGTAAAGMEEEEAGQAQVQEGRPSRTRKPSTGYPEDTYVLFGNAARLRRPIN